MGKFCLKISGIVLKNVELPKNCSKGKKKLKKTVGKESPQFEYGTGLRMLEIIAALD